uniref:F-box domain-containing protein n=1 Tax=Caenorhabditis japonica TaxID=281687 RepID=A0A8R1HX04_CAEJA
MSKLEPIWSNIPFHFKKEVVERLDYKDRCLFRRCSRSEKQLVDKCHVTLSQLAIKFSQNYSMFSYSQTGETVISVKFSKNQESREIHVETKESPLIYKPGKNEKMLWKKLKILENVENIDDIELATGEFLMAAKNLKCKKILINDVIITSEFHATPEIDRFSRISQYFCTNFLSLTNRKIETETVRIFANILSEMKEEKENCLGKFLDKFNEKSVKRIELIDRSESWDLREIAEKCKIWKNLKEIYLEMRNTLRVEHFIHADHIQMFVTDFEPHELWNVIQSFITKNKHGSAFYFNYKEDAPDVTAIFNTFNTLPNDQPIQPKTQLRIALNSRFVHTQRFAISPDLCLLVMISDREVMGTVCHVANINEEANVEMGLMR